MFCFLPPPEIFCPSSHCCLLTNPYMEFFFYLGLVVHHSTSLLVLPPASSLSPPPAHPLFFRLWTSATMVAARPSSRFQERPHSHSGVRCDRCKTGPITGSCFRCTAGCSSSRRKPTRKAGRPAAAAAVTGTVAEGGCEGCYTLCEACFSKRDTFHPPHPFARLRPGFAESRLSGPALYEAV